jgi:Mrp family chromosome partitioning ATPase/capsular polysaccharide biosynthesis protein
MDGRGYLALLARRKWIIIAFLLLLPLAAYILAEQETPVYEGSSQIYLNRQSQNLSGLNDPLVTQPERVIRTQADIARLPVIAERVVDKAGLRRSPGAFLAQSSVGSNEEVDLLTFSVRDEGRGRASALANLYAEEYIGFRRELDTKALREATQAVQKQIDDLENKGLTVNSGLYATLAQRLQQLQSAQVLQESNALLVKRAEGASQVEPQPLRSAALAFGLAIFLGLGLAFLIDALDTRVRDPEELADRLGLPLLGSLPEPPRASRTNGRIVMLDAPNSADAEPYRMLRTSLEVTAFGGGCRSLMVSSALAQEGKSTTAANLAIALARTGRHVVLVDLDLRRPSLDGFFALKSRPGITDLVFGRTSIGDAGVRLTFGGAVEQPFSGDLRLLREGDDEQGDKHEPGVLDVIGSGTLPPNPGEFMVTPELDAILKELQDRADLLIVDGPPLLLAGEALTLSSKVDALLLVARMNAFRWGQANELERVLVAAPTLKLGMIATSHAGLHRRAYYGSAPVPAQQGRTATDHAAARTVSSADGGPSTDPSLDQTPELPEAEPGRSAASGRRSWT